ncbi:MAG: hypothetical protein R6X32_03305 [Chloroflexota bacterium]
MDERIDHERRSRSLYRSGVEQLIENSSLRDGLDQEEAQALIDWATAQAKTAAYATADFDDDEKAADTVDARVREIARLLRLTTLLTTQRQQYEVEDITDLLQELALKRADFYEETAVPPHPPFDASRLRQAGSNHEAFSLLFHYITTPPASLLGLDEEE